MTILDSFDLHCAQSLIDALLDAARTQHGKPVCAALCDAHGFLIAFARADGAPVRSIAISQQKAYSSTHMGSSTTAFHARLRDEDVPIGYFCDPLLTALPGGALLRDHTGRVIGAVGLSGLAPEQDQALADSAQTHLEKLTGTTT